MIKRLTRATDATLGQWSAALAAVLFGSGYVATALALRSFSPLATAMWRGVGATVMLLLLVLLRPQGGRLAMDAGQLWRLLVLGLTGGLVLVVCMNAAVALSGATLAAFAASLSPVFAATLAPRVLKESLGARVVVAFAGATGGTALLTQANASAVNVLGFGCGLGASVAFAAFLLLSRRWSDHYRLSGQAIALSIAATTAVGLPLG